MTAIFRANDMINLGMQEFYIKMTIDGETYDPFSAETLKIMPPPYRSNKEKIIGQSRAKYTIPVEAAKRLIEEEESTIIRSAQEKAMIEGKKFETEKETEKSSEGGEPMV